MSDLAERKYKVSTLEARLAKLRTQYYEETVKPVGNWGDGMRLSKLPTNKKWERLSEKIKETEKLLQEARDEGRY